MKRKTTTAALAAILTVGAHAQDITLNTLTESVMVGQNDTDPAVAPAAVGDDWYTVAYAGAIRGRTNGNNEQRRTQWNFRFDISALAGIGSGDIASVTLSIPQIGRLNTRSDPPEAIMLHANTYAWSDDGSVDYPTWNRGRSDEGGDGFPIVAGTDSIGTYNTFGLLKDVNNTNVEGTFIITSTTGNPPDTAVTKTTEGVTALLTAVQSWADDANANEGILMTYQSPNLIGLAFGTPTLEITLATDGDGDGMSDSYETANGTDPGVNDANLDKDSDLLTNIQEYLGQDSTGAVHGYGQTLSGTADTDGDGLDDKEEVEGLLNPWSLGVSGTAPGESTDPKNQHSDGDGINDFDELDITNGSITDPNSDDSDGDQMTDDYELANGTDLVVDDAASDKDSDLLTNVQEFLGQDSTGAVHAYGQTLSGNDDSDGDGLDDKEEVEGLLNPWSLGVSGTAPGESSDPLNAHSDSDGINDFDELDATNGSVSDPNSSDSDADLMPDDYELANGTDLVVDDAGSDKDSDGLTNIQEFNGHDALDVATGYGQTLSGNDDSDGDGVKDNDEITAAENPWVAGANTGTIPGSESTNPNNVDSDNDGLEDGDELAPTVADRTDPNYFDSDLDGLPDGWEVDNGFDPLDNGTGDPNNGDQGDPDLDGVVNIDEFNQGTNPQSPPLGLVDHWAFDEAAAATDAANSANGDANRIGTVTGGVTTGVPGMLGNAYQLDGNDGHVEMDQAGGYTGREKSGARTISIWVKTADGAAGSGFGTRGCGLMGWGANGTRQRWELAYNLDSGGSRTLLAPRANYSSGTRTGSTLLNGDTWRLVTLSHEAAGTVVQTALRINGAEEVYSNTATPTGAISTVPTFNVKIGAGNDDKLAEVGYFAGLLDDAAIWDVALSGDEVACLYDLGSQLGYDASDFDVLRDLHVAGAGSVMIDGATWTYATGLAVSGGLHRAGTTGVLVLDSAAQTGFSVTGLPSVPVILDIADVRYDGTVEVDGVGFDTAAMYQMVRDIDLQGGSSTVVDGPRAAAGFLDTFTDPSPPALPSEAYYRIEQQ